MKSKLDLLKYYCIPSSRDNAFPFKISEIIAKQYKLEYLKREKITKGKKTRITFKTFYEKRSQDYKINNKIYRPKEHI